ncbi:glycoside hydrolase superfamily [Pyronema omphalodes]|nr:glycoside hydrolase superfamily [Pyronema omphalodes]
MKITITTLLVAVATLTSAAPTTSYFAGFNLGANAKDGSCKTTAQWQQEFSKIKSWSTGRKATFDTIKLFSTADCDALARAVPAALASGVKLWVGVWNVDDAKFGREKAALESAIRAYPDTSRWLKGINVGSESLYRKEISADKLAQQIYDVKGMVQIALNSPNTPVGTADTWTMWVHPDNKPVAKAVDVAIMNGFPYWQGAPIDQGLAKLKQAIWDTRKAVGYEKPFVLGETGWPSAGPNFGAAVASRENAEKYWKAAACWLQTSPSNYPWFWFSGFDEPNRESTIEQNFGVADANQNLKFSLKC